ncbi:MAG: hypothetical protein QOK86_08025 [Nitrososphaeraceae archaeon]|nr:hypothetical protein [Nitrososphaeraceae archaeon]
MDPEDIIIAPPKAKVSKKMSKEKKKPTHRSRSASKSSRSESESSERSGRSSSSSSPSPSCSPSPSPEKTYIRFKDMDRDLRNALRVSILFVYLPNCILTYLILQLQSTLSTANLDIANNTI